MPCHGCAAKFGFLVKEHGCPSCGFSFCGSCLKYKIPVPKLDNKVAKVCKTCSLLTSSDSSQSGSGRRQSCNPPDIFLRRLEALDTPPNPPITIYQDQPRLQQLLKGLNSTDLDIALRLRKLRDERRKAKHVPTEEELASRLAKLRDQDSNHDSVKPSNFHQFTTDTRSAVQQTDDLMKQTVEAAALPEFKYLEPEVEILDRLKRLQGKNKESSQSIEGNDENMGAITLDEIAKLLTQCQMEAGEGKTHPDLATIVSLEQLRARLTKHKDEMERGSTSDDESLAVQRIIAKASAEVELEQRLGIKAEDGLEMDEDLRNEELPWCIICNEDSTVRCMGCEGDLFCKDCFQQGHKDNDMCGHIFETFKPK